LTLVGHLAYSVPIMKRYTFFYSRVSLLSYAIVRDLAITVRASSRDHATDLAWALAPKGYTVDSCREG
jgi:hypothetical protein